ncbi:MAG: DUF2956 domain-containing protein [Pseudomonadota bacterium]
MAKYSKTKQVSSQTQDEAMKIARGTQKPGQTKEQTKLIAQGIQKGIDQYKKQYKIKARELDKQLKKVTAQQGEGQQGEVENVEVIKYKQSIAPWLLLIASWAGFAVFLLLK